MDFNLQQTLANGGECVAIKDRKAYKARIVAHDRHSLADRNLVVLISDREQELIRSADRRGVCFKMNVTCVTKDYILESRALDRGIWIVWWRDECGEDFSDFFYTSDAYNSFKKRKSNIVSTKFIELTEGEYEV